MRMRIIKSWVYSTDDGCVRLLDTHQMIHEIQRMIKSHVSGSGRKVTSYWKKVNDGYPEYTVILSDGSIHEFALIYGNAYDNRE